MPFVDTAKLEMIERRPGWQVLHSVRALTDGKAIVIDYPLRPAS
jgi:hypothetical protein